MARVAFDIDEKTKREIRIRLAGEGKTLSEVMRTFCSHYKDFGLHPGQQVSWEERDTLPDLSGIYFIYADKKLQYIGQTVSLAQRLIGPHHRSHQFAKMDASIFWIRASVDILAELEKWLVDTLKPPLNGSKIPPDGKNRTHTSITLSEKTLKDLDDMAKETRRSRSGMIGFLVDLFKYGKLAMPSSDEDGNEFTEGD